MKLLLVTSLAGGMVSPDFSLSHGGPSCLFLERITIWSGHLVLASGVNETGSVVVALPKSQITVQSKSGYALVVFH